MALSDAQIDKLVQAGWSDDEIAALETEDEEQPRSPRSLSEWKRTAREKEQEAAKLAARLSVYERRDSFNELRSNLSEEDRALVSFDDVKDEPKLTLSLSKVKATERQEAQQAKLAKDAAEFGFDSPESYQAALREFAERRQAQTDQQSQSMANTTSAAMNQPGTPSSTATRLAALAASNEPNSIEAMFKEAGKDPTALQRPLLDRK